MDRRLVGVLVVALAVAAALVAPGGRLTAGEAQTAPLPPEPVVGYCVGAIVQPDDAGFSLVSGPLGAVANGLGAAAGVAGPASDGWDPGAVRPGDEVLSPFGPCEGPIGGEVMLVARATGDLADRLAVASDLSDECWRATSRITGADAAQQLSLDGAADGRIAWTLSGNVRQRWMVPDARARAGGRTWLACLATPVRTVPYEGSVVSAYDGGRLPDQFGACWSNSVISVAMSAVSCAGPHRSELVAVGRIVGGSGVTAPQVRDACSDLTTEVMRRTDPTAAGAVRVAVYPENLHGRLASDRDVDITCYVVAADDREITGTVVGLGDRALGTG